MDEEIVLQTNCSEATFRIKIDNDTWNEQKEYQFFHAAFKQYKNSSNYDEDIKTLEQFKEYITENSSYYLENLFGMKCFTIHGDFPYNNGECLNFAASKLKLEYEFDE